MAAPSPAQSHPELKHFLGPSLFSCPLLPPPSTMRSSIHLSANLPRVGFPCSAPTLTDPHACSLRNVFRASKISPQLAEAAPKGPGDLSSLLHFQTNPRAKVPPLSPTIRVEERNSASLDTILTVSGREENGAFDSKVTSATVNGLPTAETFDVRSSNDSLASPDFLAYTAEKLQPSTDTDTYNTSSSSAPGNLDSLSVLHQQLEKEGGSSELFTQGREDNKQEMSLLLEKLRETRKKGLQLIKKKLRESGQPNDWEEFSCAVDPESLIPGEYVVHKIKGIGRFVCINYEIPEGKNNPVKYVFLQYADGMAKLRAKQASRLLYRYYQPGEKGKAPSLSKLNDVRIWEKKKSKGRLAVQRMVVDLMQLYVHRLQQRRHPYTKDTEAMAKFTAKFPYKPTPDQEQAFLDVERDMTERDIPMDRLICGDVGFGKTEVALRAIFRVFAAGRQVMVLAPTTVLAKQHYEVIGDRFVGYDARVALLSRYQTSSEKKDLVARIKEGSLDIIVGTHSLLGRQIHYNNLGLLVVDEEQRFGVKQKERIASFKASVDVLTLSATPIPRTLYLALTGFRDASLITTPPPERVPIITHLLEYQEEKMKAAIKFELARSGQVFYVFPRIRGLEDTKIALEGLFPGIKVGIAHGKQRGNILEETMERFAEGELDILLCTNIIESGLDIRRVNTIIVEDVHLFGLAQLYQLRGRVGRADKEAHAYLFHPDKEFLTDEALERLVALEECCGLGQGFQLAERDMAIRGFGSIFGEKQSGEVAHIGMDLFFEMLFESLSKAEHHTLPQLNYEEVKLDLEIDYHIPSDYIQDLDKRETVLHDLDVAASDGIKQLMHFTIKLRYEFGREPPSVEVLLKATYVKRMAADLGISHIWTRGKTIFMESNMSETSFEILKHSMTSDSLRSSLSFQNGQLELQALLELPSDRMLERILSCLADLRKGLPTFVKQW